MSKRPWFVFPGFSRILVEDAPTAKEAVKQVAEMLSCEHKPWIQERWRVREARPEEVKMHKRQLNARQPSQPSAKAAKNVKKAP